MRRTWIKGSKILDAGRLLEEMVVGLRDGVITSVEPLLQAQPFPEGDLVVDATGRYLTPGFIDLHVHGAAGYDVMDGSDAGQHAMASHFLRHGTTAFLATTITSPAGALERAIEGVSAFPGGEGLARCLGIHLEGPYLNANYKGAQPAQYLRGADPAEYQGWWNSQLVRRATCAPEVPGVLEMMRRGSQQGIKFSLGHSEATFAEVETAVEAGLSQATHTFNGMRGLHQREPGAAGAVLLDERIYAEVIADGLHVHPQMIRLLVKMKGFDKVMLVTDAMRATGMPDGAYDLGGEMIQVQGGAALTKDAHLAGSTLSMDQALRYLVRECGIDLAEAAAMATATPAAAMGWQDSMGRILPGYPADLVLLDATLTVCSVWLAGKLAYPASDSPGKPQ